MDTRREAIIVVKEKDKKLETKWLMGKLITEGDRKKVLVRIQGIDQNLTVEVHSSLIEPNGESIK